MGGVDTVFRGLSGATAYEKYLHAFTTLGPPR